MPSPICTVNASATINGINVTTPSTITIALADPSGVRSWSIACVGTDDTNLPATITASLAVNYTTKVATFAAPTAGSAVIFQSIVNGGINANGVVDPTLTTTFAVYVLTSQGYRACAFGETLEGSAAFGWITKLNAVIRAVPTPPTVTTTDATATSLGPPVPIAAGTIVSIEANVLANIASGACVARMRMNAAVISRAGSVSPISWPVSASATVGATFFNPPVSVPSVWQFGVVVVGNTAQIQVCGQVFSSLPAWLPSHAYASPVVVSNGGNSYALVATGASAGAGGPTGTGSSISDGTCIWAYVGTGNVPVTWTLGSLVAQTG